MDKKIEIWISITGWEGLYEISNLERVRSLPRNVKAKNNSTRLLTVRILKQTTDKLGYKRVGLHKNGLMKLYLVHQLIAKAFIINIDNKSQINHKDGNPSNNSLDNLEWVTCSENIKHSYRELGRINPMLGKNKEQCWLYGKKGAKHPCYGSKHRVGKTGELASRARKVNCNTFDIVFASATEAAQKLGLFQSEISKVCSGHIIHARGLSFRFI